MGEYYHPMSSPRSPPWRGDSEVVTPTSSTMIALFPLRLRRVWQIYKDVVWWEATYIYFTYGPELVIYCFSFFSNTQSIGDHQSLETNYNNLNQWLEVSRLCLVFYRFSSSCKCWFRIECIIWISHTTILDGPHATIHLYPTLYLISLSPFPFPYLHDMHDIF